MKRIYLSLHFILMTFILHAQTTTFEWAKSMGGVYGLAEGVDVAVDNSNNVYTTGTFEGKVDFDPGAGVFNLTSSRNGDQDIFICKYDNTGNFIWAKQIGALGDNNVASIAVSTSGDVYITGYFAGAVDFDPGPSVFILSSGSFYDSFILKLDNSGNFVWARQLGDNFNGYVWSYSIAVDVTGNVYTTGQFQGNADFDPGPGIYNLDTGGPRDIFVSKLDVSGNLVWAKQFGGSNNNQGNSIAVDGSGNVYTTGYFKDTVDFDPGPAVLNFVSPGWIEDIFVSKLDAGGNLLWARQMGGASEDIASSIAVDASGNVYTTGNYMATVDFNPSAGIYNLTASTYRDIFISKLDAFGNFVWAKSQGGTGDDHGYSIAVDGPGNIYTTGYFWGTGDFDPGPGTVNLTSIGGFDVFVSKLLSNGSLVWIKQLGGTNHEEGNSIAVDGSGNVLTTGYFSGNADFDPGTATANLPALGNCAFISKLSSVGNYVWAKGFGKNAVINSKSLSTDLAGNVFTTGYFYGAVDFDPGPGVFNLITAAPDPLPDIFVSKTDPSGNLVWAKQISGVSAEYSNGITTDAVGNIFITGAFNGTVDFDPGPGVFNLTATSTEAFVAKLNTSGNLVWAKQTTAGASSSAEAISIAVDALGNIITTGWVYNTVDFDPGPATFNLISSNSTGIFIWKLDNSGNFIWAKQMGSPTSLDDANSIAVDAAGNVYSTGTFSSTADFDPGPGTYNLTPTPNGQFDIYISKLDASGNFVWAKQIGGAYSEGVNSITSDVSGNVYATGSFGGTVDFDPGPGTYFLNSTDGLIFILKINSSGNFVWVKQLVGGSYGTGNSIITDASGNIYTTGNFLGPIDFDPDSGTYTLGSYSFGDDVFILKLDTSGHFVWANTLGYNPANINTFEADQYGNGITIDGSGNVYTTGNFYGAADFDPDTSAFYISSIGNPDMFIHKISQCPWANITAAGATAFCPGGSVTLNANTGAGLSYQWKKNGNNIPGAIAASYTASTAGNYTVVVSGSCGSTTSPVVTVTKNPLPSATITAGGPTTFCSGDSVILNAPTGAGYSYQWKKNGTNIPGAVNSNYTATASGMYKVTVTNTNTGCSKTSAAGIVVTVNALPVSMITPSGTISFCQGQSALLSANSGAGYTWQWTRNNIPLSGATAQTYTVTGAGKYRVAVTNMNGCTKTSLTDTVLVPCVGNDTIDDARFGRWMHGVSIFPNPNTGEFTIQFSDKPIEPVTIELTDVIGNVVLKFIMTSNTAEIKTPNLSNGIYYLKIRDNDNMLTRKINILKQ